MKNIFTICCALALLSSCQVHRYKVEERKAYSEALSSLDSAKIYDLKHKNDPKP